MSITPLFFDSFSWLQHLWVLIDSLHFMSPSSMTAHSLMLYFLSGGGLGRGPARLKKRTLKRRALGFF